MFFAALFTVIATLQYLFIRYEIRQTVSDQLDEWAEDLLTTVFRGNKLDFAAVRRAAPQAPAFLIAASDGAVIATQGFVTETMGHVALPVGLSYDRPLLLTSSLGEQWHLLGRRVNGGSVVVGAPSTDCPPDIDARLVDTAKRFGGTIASAMELHFRDIDANVDFAVVRDDGILLDAYGGIPLTTTPNSLAALAAGPIVEFEHTPYFVRSRSIVNNTGRAVGTILVMKDIGLEQRMLHKSAVFNIVAGSASWLATAVLVLLHFYKQRGPRFTCEEALGKDESQTVEFKSSFRWDYREGKASKEVERAVVKTVAGFLNSREGGALVIGVDDKKSLLGLEAEYQTLSTRPNRDGFEQALHQTLTNAVGVRNYNRIHIDFCKIQGHDICVL